ncbi:DUF1307 domain-containing protein [Streptococcus oricebi]|uniref:DUF1307 domain-containing protein n=1 Tax=Streptococcus oricebi TaxID=1547447 RepID=A0ABS5B5I8_9STRE|nr:DUF1307 domain-containing protein [Streptococcus oricebi]MBP2624106.1 hypothetical protein [Streptococcus oricebi]
MKNKHFVKWLLGLVTLTLLTVLAACGSGKEQVRYFQQIDQSSKIDIRMTYYYKGDTVTKQTTESQIPYSRINATDEASARTIVEPKSKQYQTLAGVKESITYEKDGIKESLEIDYEKVDFKKLAEVDSAFASSGGADAKKVSMKASAKLLENNNFKEVKDGKFESLK